MGAERGNCGWAVKGLPVLLYIKAALNVESY